MFNFRTLVIIAIVFAVLCGGLTLFVRYSNKTFEASLPTVPTENVAIESVSNTPTVANEAAHDNKVSPIGNGGVSRQNIDKKENAMFSPPPKAGSASPKPGDIDKIDETTEFQEIRDTTFDNAFSFFGKSANFETVDWENTRIQLEELLRTLHGDNPSVSAFLRDWDTTKTIMSLRAAYDASGSLDSDLRDQIFDLMPTEVIPKAFDQSVELLQPSAEVESQHRQWLENWIPELQQAEAAHIAAHLAHDAVAAGEITVQEAEDFVEDVSGLDVDIVPIESTD